MTPPTDSLVAALRAALDAMDVVVCIRGQSEMCPCCRARASAEGRASLPALAAAVREWIRRFLPEPCKEEWLESPSAEALAVVRGWNNACNKIARRLGL